jgi:hypothetical protein
VSVKDFGAVGDGATNDAPAIQAAVTSGAVYVAFPPGNYRITSSITLTSSVSVVFESGAYTSGTGSISGGTIFRQSGSGAATRSQAAAVAGSVMGIEGIVEESEYSLKGEAGIWPGKTFTFQGISKTFDSGYNSTTPSPATALFVFANNKNTNTDVVGIMSDCVSRTTDDIVFAANFIARNDSGANNVKLVGLEIDIQPASGTTINSNSIGLALNIFTIPTSVPAIQIGGVSGGSWNNGIVINGVSGAGVAAQSGATMATLINATGGTYSDTAIRLSTGITNAIFFGVDFANGSPRIFGDSSGNLKIDTGTAFGKLLLTGKANMSGLPTSSAGLVSGDVWINGSVLNIVP